jgi:hypothetical protein
MEYQIYIITFLSIVVFILMSLILIFGLIAYFLYAKNIWRSHDD